MKQILTLALVAVMLLSSGAFAFPNLFDVWVNDGGGPTWLGQISAYTGSESHAANYGYSSASGHPVNGPTPLEYQSQAWLYHNTSNDTYSFNIIHNKDGGGGNYWSAITMNLFFGGMNYGVILQDDDPENQGQGGFQDQGGGLLWADFAYKDNSDGGVIGIDPFDCCDWWIGIEPLAFGDIQEFGFASGDGNYVSAWESLYDLPTGLGPNDIYRGADESYPYFKITPHCEVPEPGTLMLLGMGLLTAGGVLRRRNK
ncbi:MAG: PEP-CTERM sorting domain-containing protein [bacterium]